MFYCEPCRVERDWPESIAQSKGPCECCSKTAICHDWPSRTLPLPVKFKPGDAVEIRIPITGRVIRTDAAGDVWVQLDLTGQNWTLSPDKLRKVNPQ